MARRLFVTSLCGVLACSGGAGGGEDASTGTTILASVTEGVSETGVTMNSAASSTSEPTTSSSTGSSTTGDSSGFVVTVDVPGELVACDTFTQDCPEGMKCEPYAEGGGSSWNATKCVPVNGDQIPGEPCTAEGNGASGLDDCVEGAMCWDVDAMNVGTCVALCTGSPEQPTCPAPKSGCATVADGVLNICLSFCEPLIQDCPVDALCLPVNDAYGCVIDASGEMGAAFDPCEYANACDQGLVCLPSTSASECDPKESGCCLPMCSLAEGDAACPGAGQQCLPMYEPQPLGYEDIGDCSLMPL